MTRSALALATLLWLSIFVVLSVPFCFWPLRAGIVALVDLCIYSLVSVVMSVELCELFLALVWRPVPLPATVEVAAARRRRVAVLMTVCDDASLDHLSALEPLADAGYDIFLLDDSTAPAQLPQPIAHHVVVVRRGERTGAKAGNLNHWLWTRGVAYESILLLDSDSVMPLAAADALVSAASHPANATTAIFQAAVLPRAGGTPTWLQRVLAAGATVRRRIHARVLARLDVLLSFGHNQLIRLASVRAVGGFDEGCSAEDTALSLMLVAAGHRVAFVDVCTYDTDPSTLDRYVQRTVRWARQTVELFSRPWRPVPLRYKLVLCWHLLSYLMPLLVTTLLLLSLWQSPESPARVVDFSIAALRLESGYEYYGVAMWPGILAVVLRASLATVIAVVDGGRIVDRVRAGLVGGAIQAFMVLPLAAGMLASAWGQAVPFEPTNALRTEVGKRWQLLVASVGALGLCSAMTLGLAVHPGGALVGLNGLWCVGLLGVPLLVVHAFRRRRAEPR